MDKKIDIAAFKRIIKKRADDPLFQLLVSSIYEFTETYCWTLEEVMAAAVAASIRYEYEHKDDKQNRF